MELTADLVEYPPIGPEEETKIKDKKKKKIYQLNMEVEDVDFGR